MALEKIFQRTLLQIPNIQLWSMYLDHIRRHNNVTTDASGEARQIIHQAYDLALQHVGLDKDSGKLWQDYVQFIKSGPGNIGGSNWQDQQKMDLLRKVYQRAICVPTQSTNMLWKEYDSFEMGLNKITVVYSMVKLLNYLLIRFLGSQIPSRSVSIVHVCPQFLHRASEHHPAITSNNSTCFTACSWM